MTTKSTIYFPEIEWELSWEVLSLDPEEREKVYVAKGTDREGNNYLGEAHVICGELEEIKNPCKL